MAADWLRRQTVDEKGDVMSGEKKNQERLDLHTTHFPISPPQTFAFGNMKLLLMITLRLLRSTTRIICCGVISETQIITTKAKDLGHANVVAKLRQTYQCKCDKQGEEGDPKC